MKKAIIAGLALLAAAGMSYGKNVTVMSQGDILAVNWSDLVSGSSGYYIAFYTDGGDGVSAVTGTPGAWSTGNDTLVASGWSSAPSWQGDGFFMGTYNTAGSAWGPVFGRVYDTTVNPLTQSTFNYMNLLLCDENGAATTDYTFSITADPAGPPPPEQFVLLTKDNSQNRWQYVPEPGTMALFGLGAVTMAIRRFRRK
jgi:hypothetical protein